MATFSGQVVITALSTGIQYNGRLMWNSNTTLTNWEETNGQWSATNPLTVFPHITDSTGKLFDKTMLSNIVWKFNDNIITNFDISGNTHGIEKVEDVGTVPGLAGYNLPGIQITNSNIFGSTKFGKLSCSCDININGKKITWSGNITISRTTIPEAINQEQYVTYISVTSTGRPDVIDGTDEYFNVRVKTYDRGEDKTNELGIKYQFFLLDVKDITNNVDGGVDGWYAMKIDGDSTKNLILDNDNVANKYDGSVVNNGFKINANTINGSAVIKVVVTKNNNFIDEATKTIYDDRDPYRIQLIADKLSIGYNEVSTIKAIISNQSSGIGSAADIRTDKWEVQCFKAPLDNGSPTLKSAIRSHFSIVNSDSSEITPNINGVCIKSKGSTQTAGNSINIKVQYAVFTPDAKLVGSSDTTASNDVDNVVIVAHCTPS